MSAERAAARPPEVLLREEAIDAIRAHGARTFPSECCGALIAVDGTIVEAMGLDNTTDGEPRRRFRIDPRDYLSAEKHARSLGGALVGFYHSHPNAPSRPSAYDLEHAWPMLIYAIVSVVDGTPDQFTAWWLRDDRSGFDELPILTRAA